MSKKVGRPATSSAGHIYVATSAKDPELWAWLRESTEHFVFGVSLLDLLAQDMATLVLDDAGWDKLTRLDVGGQECSRETAQQLVEELIGIGFLDEESYHAGYIWSPEYANGLAGLVKGEKKKLWREGPLHKQVIHEKVQSAEEQTTTIISRAESMMPPIMYMEEPDPDSVVLSFSDSEPAVGLQDLKRYYATRVTIWQDNEYEVAVKDYDAYAQVLEAAGGDQTLLQERAKAVLAHFRDNGPGQKAILPKSNYWDGSACFYALTCWPPHSTEEHILTDLELQSWYDAMTAWECEPENCSETLSRDLAGMMDVM